MSKNMLTVASWIALGVSLAAWTGVVFFSIQLLRMQDERVAYVNNVAAASLEEGQAAQLHALARETAPQREILAKAANVDVISAVNLIENIRSGAAKVSVIGAQAEKPIPGKGGATPINVVSLSLRTEGSFADVMQIAQKIETVPLATIIQNVNLARPPLDASAKTAPGLWVLDVRLRFFTTTPLST